MPVGNVMPKVSSKYFGFIEIAAFHALAQRIETGNCSPGQNTIINYLSLIHI